MVTADLGGKDTGRVVELDVGRPWADRFDRGVIFIIREDQGQALALSTTVLEVGGTITFLTRSSQFSTFSLAAFTAPPAPTPTPPPTPTPTPPPTATSTSPPTPTPPRTGTPLPTATPPTHVYAPHRHAVAHGYACTTTDCHVAAAAHGYACTTTDCHVAADAHGYARTATDCYVDANTDGHAYTNTGGPACAPPEDSDGGGVPWLVIILASIAAVALALDVYLWLLVRRARRPDDSEGGVQEPDGPPDSGQGDIPASLEDAADDRNGKEHLDEEGQPAKGPAILASAAAVALDIGAYLWRLVRRAREPNDPEDGVQKPDGPPDNGQGNIPASLEDAADDRNGEERLDEEGQPAKDPPD